MSVLSELNELDIYHSYTMRAQRFQYCYTSCTFEYFHFCQCFIFKILYPASDCPLLSCRRLKSYVSTHRLFT